MQLDSRGWDGGKGGGRANARSRRSPCRLARCDRSPGRRRIDDLNRVEERRNLVDVGDGFPETVMGVQPIERHGECFDGDRRGRCRCELRRC